MNGEQRKRRAAWLLILATGIFSAEWVPAVSVAAFALWVIFHRWLEGDPGEVLRRRWRRVWPPATVVLIPLVLASTFWFWVSDRSVEAKLLPIALNAVALSVIVRGGWSRRASSSPAT